MELKLNSQRARQARLAALIGHVGEILLLAGSVVLVVPGVAVWITTEPKRLAFAFLSLALFAFVIGVWYRRDLAKLQPNPTAHSLDGILEPRLLACFKKGQPATPRSAWQAAISRWQGKFV